jgi:hypothetical protein
VLVRTRTWRLAQLLERVSPRHSQPDLSDVLVALTECCGFIHSGIFGCQ